MLWVLLWFESSSVEKKMYGKGIKWYDYCKKRYKTGNMLIALTLHNHAFILQCACSHYTVGTNHFQCSSLTALFPVQQRNLVNKQSWLASTAAHNNYTSEARARQGGIKNPKRVYPSFLSAIHFVLQSKHEHLALHCSMLHQPTTESLPFSTCVISCISSSETSSGKNLARNLNCRGVSFLTSWLRTWNEEISNKIVCFKMCADSQGSDEGDLVRGS